VKTIIAMADALGADVVAEGIETEGQLRVLQSLECHRAQGYFISKPVATADVPDTVKQLHDVETWSQRTTRD
jgi:EAL domain-containing protein (putative c-di-GMP-specific phosphodiesterase class I)